MEDDSDNDDFSNMYDATSNRIFKQGKGEKKSRRDKMQKKSFFERKHHKVNKLH